MGAPDILARLHAVGVNLSRQGSKLIATPKAAVTPEIVDLIRAHKPELLAALDTPALIGAITDEWRTEASSEVSRRTRVLAMLDERPNDRLAVVTEEQGDRVIVTVAIRDKATAEFWIRSDRYDGVRLMELIERTVH